MKNKCDWFDENGKPNAKLHTVILELLLSPTYRWPMRVTEVHIYKDESTCAQCPRCKGSIEYEYQFFCGRCGQRLDWFRFENARKVVLLLYYTCGQGVSQPYNDKKARQRTM